MVSVKLFRDPNNNFRENVSKFWTAYSGWIQSNKFDYDLVYSEYGDAKRGLNVNWEELYMEYLGRSVPFNISMFNESNWEEIQEFIEITYCYVIREEKKDAFIRKINEYLSRFKLDYMFLKGKFIHSDFIEEQEHVKEVLEWIDAYPDAAKSYRSALSKISDGIYDRNAIDDMRLALESLIRELVGTKKTLENQIQPLGALLKEKGVPVHIANLITTIITHYTKYQNDNVKHHDAVNKDDLEFLVNLTADIMKYTRDRLT